MLKRDQKELLENLLLHDIRVTERRRVHLLLMYDRGMTTGEIAKEVDLSTSRVRYWKRTFLAKGMEIFPSLSNLQEFPEAPGDFLQHDDGLDLDSDILDADLFVGAGFEQTFDMAVGNLTATLEFEDGSSQAFTFGDSLVFENASDMDVDGDGEVEFNFVFDVEDTMVTNDTDMDFDGGWNFDVLKGSAYLDTTLGSTSASVGPVVDLGGVFNIATIDVYSDTFELNFEEQDYMLVA